MELLPKNTFFVTGTFVSHANVWVFLSNGNVQYKYLFPRLMDHSRAGSPAD